MSAPERIHNRDGYVLAGQRPRRARKRLTGTKKHSVCTSAAIPTKIRPHVSHGRLSIMIGQWKVRLRPRSQNILAFEVIIQQLSAGSVGRAPAGPRFKYRTGLGYNWSSNRGWCLGTPESTAHGAQARAYIHRATRQNVSIAAPPTLHIINSQSGWLRQNCEFREHDCLIFTLTKLENRTCDHQRLHGIHCDERQEANQEHAARLARKSAFQRAKGEKYRRYSTTSFETRVWEPQVQKQRLHVYPNPIVVFLRPERGGRRVGGARMRKRNQLRQCSKRIKSNSARVCELLGQIERRSRTSPKNAAEQPATQNDRPIQGLRGLTMGIVRHFGRDRMTKNIGKKTGQPK